MVREEELRPILVTVIFQLTATTFKTTIEKIFCQQASLTSYTSGIVATSMIFAVSNLYHRRDNDRE